MIKLNLGCGPDIKKDYLNIDTCPFNDSVIQSDIRNLSFLPNSVDEIYAKDILEHLSISDAKKAIQNWSTICKSGALLFIQTICIDLIIEAYQKGIWNLEVMNYMLFAGKNWVNGISKNEDFHKSCYSKSLLENILISNGFAINNIEYDKIDKDLINNPYSHNLNIIVTSTKL